MKKSAPPALRVALLNHAASLIACGHAPEIAREADGRLGFTFPATARDDLNALLEGCLMVNAATLFDELNTLRDIAKGRLPLPGGAR